MSEKDDSILFYHYKIKIRIITNIIDRQLNLRYNHAKEINKTGQKCHTICERKRQ